MSDGQNPSRVHYIHRLSASFQQRVVGIFVLAAVLVIAGLVLLQIQSSHILDDRIEYDAYLTNAQGVSTDTLVNVSGIDVGQVQSIDITEENKVHVQFFVYDRFQRLLRTDSEAELSKLSVIGNTVIIISAGSHEMPILQAGSTIAIEEPVTIDELITRLTPVVTSLNSIVEKVAAVVDAVEEDKLESTIEDFSVIVAELRQVSEQINRGRGLVGRLAYDENLADEVSTTVTDLGDLVKSVDPVVRKVDPLMDETRSLIETINANMKQVESLLVETEARVREVSKVLQPAEGLVQRSNRIADDIKTTTGVVSEEIRHLPDMVNKMQNLLDSTNRTIQNAQEVWPLSTVIPPGDTETRIPNQPLDD